MLFITQSVALFAAMALMVIAAPAPEAQAPTPSPSVPGTCIKRPNPSVSSVASLPGDVLLASPSSSAMPAPSGNLEPHPSNAAVSSAASSVVPAPSPSVSAGSPGGSSTGKRFVAYWSIWHAPTELPTNLKEMGVTDVIMAFMYMATESSEVTWAEAAVPFSDANIAALQADGIRVSAAIGGWNLDNVFRPAVQTEASRTLFAQKLVSFVRAKGLDGIDLDWEYPGGNGQNYLLPESDPKARPLDLSDGPKFVAAAAEIRKQLDALGQELGKTMTLSIAVPARPADLIVFNDTSVTTGLDASLDYWNLMTYDYINRRDTHTGNHAGDQVIADVVSIYKGYGLDAQKLNIGYPMYAKWFFTGLTQTTCPPPHLGCPFGVQYENATGGDTDKSAAMVFNAVIETNQAALGNWSAFAPTGEESSRVEGGGSTTIIETDSTEPDSNYFFTWLSKEDVAESCAKHLPEVGGVFIWALNQDTANSSPRLNAVAACHSSAQ